MEAESDEVLCEKQGAAGLITLNRPKALNALTLAMVREMRRALDAWDVDPAVTRIVVKGAGEKAFCAGGDIRRLTRTRHAGKPRGGAGLLARGIPAQRPSSSAIPSRTSPSSTASSWAAASVLSLHGRYRVAGERYLFAMPEVAIGFFPDVGATYALPRLPGWTGPISRSPGSGSKRADGLMLGLATHAVARRGFRCADRSFDGR